MYLHFKRIERIFFTQHQKMDVSASAAFIGVVMLHLNLYVFKTNEHPGAYGFKQSRLRYIVSGVTMV